MRGVLSGSQMLKGHGQELNFQDVLASLQDGPDDPHLLVSMPLCNPLSR